MDDNMPQDTPKILSPDEIKKDAEKKVKEKELDKKLKEKKKEQSIKFDPDTKVIDIDGEEYEYVPGPSVAASDMIVKTWERLGKPDTPLSEAGSKLMKVMIAVWEDLWPKEAKLWYKVKNEYRKEELSTKEQVHQRTGRSLASIPTPIYQMMRKVFPEFKMNNREQFMDLVKKHPVFQMTKKR